MESTAEGGGDVIKFAGDCIIAVFPERDYRREGGQPGCFDPTYATTYVCTTTRVPSRV